MSFGRVGLMVRRVEITVGGTWLVGDGWRAESWLSFLSCGKLSSWRSTALFPVPICMDVMLVSLATSLVGRVVFFMV